jgi:glyoxalase superfamily protein
MRRTPHPYLQGELAVVIDCSDLDRSATFWANMLGYVRSGPPSAPTRA